MTLLVVMLACLASLATGWFLASLAWASARADLESEIMELRRRVLNLTRDETHA